MKSVLEGVQCIAGQSMNALDIQPHGTTIDETIASAAIEQVRATYALATVMARIHEALTTIQQTLEAINGKVS